MSVRGIVLGLTRREIRQLHDPIVAFSGLDEEVLSSPLYTLSSGMMLRLVSSVALHMDPDVFVLDEVLAVGDEAFRHACMDRVDLLRQGGMAAVVASHDQHLLATCDRVLVLDRGRVKFIGQPDDAWEIYSRNKTPLVVSGDRDAEPQDRAPTKPVPLRSLRPSVQRGDEPAALA